MRNLNLLILVCVFSGGAYAQQDKTMTVADMHQNQRTPPIPNPQMSKNGDSMALAQIHPRATLTVTSTAFSANQTIPEIYSDLGEKTSPPLQWTAVPDSTKSLVILMEDPDAPKPQPFVHWVLYDLAPTLTNLPIGIPTEPQLPAFGNARQGINSRGSIGYFGPHPPPDHDPHHYHFQIFALDKRLDLLPGNNKDEVVAAMRDHVLVAGELVGMYGQKKSLKP